MSQAGVMAEDVFPDRNMSHREKIEFMLEREGWAMDTVGPSGDADAPIPRYTYTVGFDRRFGFPELVVFGLSPVACRGLFELVAAAVAGGTDLPVGRAFIGLLEDDQPCALLPVDAAEAVGMFPALAEDRVLAGERPDDFTMLQLTWPDPEGRLPWEEGFSASLAPLQLLLGEPPEG